MLSVSGGCPLTIIVSRAVLASKGLSWPLAAGSHRPNRTVVSVNSLENNPRFAVAAPKVVAIIPSLTHCGPLYRARDVDAAGTGSRHIFHIRARGVHRELTKPSALGWKNDMTVCAICDGVGLVRVMDAAGHWVSRACECQEAEREQRRMQAAQIPPRYKDCTLDAFDPSYPGADASLTSS